MENTINTKKINSKNQEEKKITIEIQDLKIFYKKGNKPALKGVSLDIYKKSVTALIGPSGCGKSTLLRSINRMNDLIPDVKTEGKILVEGKNIYSSKQNVIKLRTAVGMVFQKPNPFKMSIYDNVVFGPKSQGVKNKEILNKIVKESLEKAALWDEVKDILRDPAESLSGGQQQRLCIARAIAMQPKILLMDEPTSALDPVSTKKIEDLIRQLKTEFTIIIVTHQMQQAARIADYTAFLLSGELIEFNETKLIFSKPNNKKTEDYVTGRYS